MTERCDHCRHFGGGAAAFERALPGVRVLSSAMASVRGDDGLCRLHDRIVQPLAICAAFDGGAAPQVPAAEALSSNARADDR